MKSNRKAVFLGVIAIAIVVAAVIFFLLLPSRNEPIYQRKSLTRWLKQLDDGQAFGISSSSALSLTPAQQEAFYAIRMMGTNALPLLMEDIHVHPAQDAPRFKLRDKLLNLWAHFTGSRPFISDLTEEDRVRWRAAQGLSALGPHAQPAIPELTRLLYTNYFHSSIKEAAYALAGMGPQGIAVLTNAVQSNEWSGMCAIWALGQHPEAGAKVIPFLISATRSKSEGTACGAIQALGLLHTDAEQVVPALTNTLTSTNSSVSRDSARSLGEFGAQARPAVPLLQSLTNNPAAKGEAITALEKIKAQ